MEFCSLVKISGVWGGLLLLFVLIHHLLDMSVDCITYWLQVKVRQLISMGASLLQANEIFLGYHCPVLIDQVIFVFCFILTLCGISVHECSLGMINESSIT